MRSPGNIKKVCLCGKEFFTTQGRLDDNRGKYCSMKCKYKYKTRQSGLTYIKHKENPTSFKKGLIPWNKGTKGVSIAWNKGIKSGSFSKETEFKSGYVPWNKGKEGLRDSLHPLWAGDNVGYGAVHSYIYRRFGKADRCDKCGNTKSKVYDWHNKTGEYKRDVTDWEMLCRKCHINLHRKLKNNITQLV